MIINYNSGDLKNIKSQSVKIKNLKKNSIPQDNEQTNENESDDTYHPIVKNEKKNSFDIYIKHKSEKKNDLNNSNDKINIDIKNEKDNFNIINNEISEKIKKREKKITFKEPNFVEIIDVESYKKFNEENTSKDPYDHLYNNDNNNKKKDDGKEKVVCSCFII